MKLNFLILANYRIAERISAFSLRSAPLSCLHAGCCFHYINTCFMNIDHKLRSAKIPLRRTHRIALGDPDLYANQKKFAEIQ